MVINLHSYLFYLNIEIIINQNLYQKKIIDEKTFLTVNEKLLKRCEELN